FQPMLKIVPNDGIFAMVALDMKRADVMKPHYTAQFTAPTDGRVYFFVNDVLLPKWMPNADRFYNNNLGSATIAIEKVVAPDAARGQGAGSRARAALDAARAQASISSQSQAGCPARTAQIDRARIRTYMNPYAAIPSSTTSATSMRRRRSRAGARTVNSAKQATHSGEPNICTALSRAASGRRGATAGTPRPAWIARIAASPMIAKARPATESADQRTRLRRRNQSASPVGASEVRTNTAPPYIISPPAIMPPIAWLSAAENF